MTNPKRATAAVHRKIPQASRRAAAQSPQRIPVDIHLSLSTERLSAVDASMLSSGDVVRLSTPSLPSDALHIEFGMQK